MIYLFRGSACHINEYSRNIMHATTPVNKMFSENVAGRRFNIYKMQIL